MSRRKATGTELAAWGGGGRGHTTAVTRTPSLCMEEQVFRAARGLVNLFIVSSVGE